MLLVAGVEDLEDDDHTTQVGSLPYNEIHFALGLKFCLSPCKEPLSNSNPIFVYLYGGQRISREIEPAIFSVLHLTCFHLSLSFCLGIGLFCFRDSLFSLWC